MTDPTDRSTLAGSLQTDSTAWDRFVSDAAAASYLQASPWAAVKAFNGWRSVRVVAEATGGPVGAQLLVRHPRPLPRGFGYAARGPLSAAPLDAASIGAFTEAVRAAAGSLRVSHVRVDPEVADPDGEFARAFRSAGWRPAPAIQPGSTRIIDLDRSEDQIWSDIHRKWRQSVTKAGRDGTTVGVPCDPRALDGTGRAPPPDRGDIPGAVGRLRPIRPHGPPVRDRP